MTSAADHLTPDDLEALSAELDAVRAEVVADLGEADARYIRRIIAVQRGLEVTGRGLLLFSRLPPAWLAGTAALALAKILDNMEIGHNVLHGQWDWMRDPKIHSTTWEWDFASPAESWQRSHNYYHHTFTNIRGRDRDLGYTIMRVVPEQEWKPVHLFQPIYNMGLAAIFEWGIAMFDLELVSGEDGTKAARSKADKRKLWRKGSRQLAKDYLVFPALSGPGFVATLAANATACLVRNVWAHAVIFCGHFPAGTESFDESRLDGETKGEWYVRQMLGSANLTGSRLFHIMTGNLSHQIEHHLYPDVASNRYAEMAVRVREICARYGLPYNAGPMSKQYGSVLRKLARLALPERKPKRAAAAGGFDRSRAVPAGTRGARPVPAGFDRAPADLVPSGVAG